MAKFCPNCGTALADAAKFCPGCGAQIPAAQPQQSQQYIQPPPYPVVPPPPPAKKKSKALFIVIGATVALLVVLVAIIVISANRGGPGPAERDRTTVSAPGPTDGGDPATQPYVTSRTAAATQPTQPTATQPPNGNIDPALVGMWSSGINSIGDWHNATTGAYEYTSGIVEGIEFKADGTFRCFSFTNGKIRNDNYFFYSWHNGSYRTENNTIYLTNVMTKFTQYKNGSIDQEYTHDFTPVEDHILGYSWFDFSGEERLSLKHPGGSYQTEWVHLQYNQGRVID